MDITKFYERVGLSPDTKGETTLQFLKKLQLASLFSIPYENIEQVSGKAVSLNPDDVYDKVVIRKRGGYCFELNALFQRALNEIGFVTERYLARFWRGEEGIPIRRHRVTGVFLDGEEYIVDIGIGAIAPRFPLLLKAGVIQENFGESYRFEYEEDFGWVLYELYHGEWQRYFSFTTEKQFEDDFISPAYYCDMHPNSKFNKVYMVAIKTENGRKTLSDRTFKEFVGTELFRVEENMTEERTDEILLSEFGIKR